LTASGGRRPKAVIKTVRLTSTEPPFKTSGKLAEMLYRALFLTLVLFFPLAGNAANRLRGTWQSDHEMTMKFVVEHALLEPRQKEFLDGSLGRLRMSFDGNQMRHEMPDVNINIQGKVLHFVGADETCRYRVVGADYDSVALMLDQCHGRDRIIHLHFVSDEVFWLYSEESDYGLRDLNIREYFQRVK
jgi:hypothetical protein